MIISHTLDLKIEGEGGSPELENNKLVLAGDPFEMQKTNILRNLDLKQVDVSPEQLSHFIDLFLRNDKSVFHILLSKAEVILLCEKIGLSINSEKERITDADLSIPSPSMVTKGVPVYDGKTIILTLKEKRSEDSLTHQYMDLKIKNSEGLKESILSIFLK